MEDFFSDGNEKKIQKKVVILKSGDRGDPQGSVLASIISLVHINDINKTIKTNNYMFLFVDDSKHKERKKSTNGVITIRRNSVKKNAKY